MHTHGKDFHGLGIAPRILELLTAQGFSRPTPIQHQCIPVGMEGKDIIGIAQTGTGKTLAFGIPMLQSLVQHRRHGLILVPTRELAVQVEEMLRPIASGIGLKTAVLIGGESILPQARRLRTDPELIVATPGRLNDHLEQRNVALKDVRVVVLDEADRMLDMGFAPQIEKILRLVPRERQTMLFSATMPAEIVRVASQHMKLPVRVEVAPAGTAARDVSQELFFVESADRTELLEGLLKQYPGSVLIFARTRRGARRLSRQLRNAGHSTAELHADRSQGQRRDAMEGFRIGRYRILVATDIAARGIDVSDIELVVNYDLPANPEDYVHRIGRTGRAGAAGHAISFAMPHQRGEVKSIEALIRSAVRVSPLPHLARKSPVHAAPPQRPPAPGPGFGKARRGPLTQRRKSAK